MPKVIQPGVPPGRLPASLPVLSDLTDLDVALGDRFQVGIYCVLIVLVDGFLSIGPDHGRTLR